MWIAMKTQGGYTMCMICQVADVTKSQDSTGRKDSRGRRFVLGDEDSHIQHKEKGRNIKLHKKGIMLVLRMECMGP